MAADNLDIDLPICYVDPDSKEIKATAYFEDYLFKIVETLGGEGSTLIQDLLTSTIEADKVEYMFALFKTLRKQVGGLEARFDSHSLLSAIKQIQIDTAKFNSRIETTNYTAVNKDWVEARNTSTISLPLNPVRNDEVIVSNGDGSAITIDGNGSDIKYTSTDTSVVIFRQGDSLSFMYFSDNVLSEAYWRAV